MRRIGSYGGPSGVAGSERLKQRLLSTPGLHLLSSSSLGEAGSLAAGRDAEDERVIHRTIGASRNFHAIASNLKNAKRDTSENWKDPLAPLVKEAIVIEEPVHPDQHCKSVLLAEEVDGSFCSKQGLIENGPREVGVEGIPGVLSSDSQVINGIELEEAIQMSLLLCSVDLSWERTRSQCSLVGATLHRKESDSAEDLSTADSSPLEPSYNQECESSLLEAGELQEAGSHLETERIFTTLAEADCCVSTFPTSDGQDSWTFRVEKFEAPAGKVFVRNNEISPLLGTGGGLQDSENKLSKEMASVEIQSCWRGWQERKHFKLLKDIVVSRQSLVPWNQEINPSRRISQAAILLQKHWRAFQRVKALKRLYTEKGLREQRKVNNPAAVVQEHWRFAQCRRVLYKLREERGVRAQQRNDHAALVVQKHWRAHRGRTLVKYLKVEQVAREQQRIGAVAVLLRKHWQAWRGSFLVKHLEMEQAAEEKQRINAAIVLQKLSRAQQDRYSMKHLGIEQLGKEKQMINDAVLVLHKQWRAHRGRSYLKLLNVEQVASEQQRIDHAALVIQKHWRAHQRRCFVEQLRMEQAARVLHKPSDAALVLQKHLRVQQGWCLLKLEHIISEKQRMDGSTVVQRDWRAHQNRVLAEQMRKEHLEKQRKMDHADVVLQKCWRGRQRRYLVKDLKKKQLVKNAVTVVQRWWRDKQGRLKMNRIKMELAARQMLRANAAITLQKHWRARQSVLLVKRMKMEEAVREQVTLDKAAITIQKHWRGQHSRLFVKHLNREMILWELKRDNSAAMVLQKYWRSFQSRQAVKFLYTERAGKELADELGRNNATRAKLKAALTIQKAWQSYWSSRSSLSAVSIQHPLSSSSNQKRTMEAVRVLQKYARGFVDRRRLGQMRRSADASLQPDRTEIERYTETGIAVVTCPDVMLTGSSLHASRVSGYFSRAEVSVESSPSSSIVRHVEAGVGSLDESSSPSDRWPELECAPLNSRKQDLSASLGLDDEFSARSVEEAQVQKNGVQECWSCVAVDQLEKCLDTCLAALRPLPSKTQYCLPGLDVADKCQFICADQYVEDSNVYIGKVGSKSSYPINHPSNQSRIQSDYVTSHATLTGAKDHLETTFRPVEVAVTQKTDTPTRGKSLGRQPAEQNEQLLKQFAQVFLLQRHISLQQQRAQAAPPFPPPMPARSEIPSLVVTQPDKIGRGDQGEAVQIISMHIDSLGSQVEGRRPEEHHAVCEIDGPEDEQLVTRGSQACQNSGSKQIFDRPGPDVVLDTEFLLRQIEGKYRTSDGDFKGESSTWSASGCGDIEEGRTLLDRNSWPKTKQITLAKYVNAENVKHVSKPDVNAVLLVFLAIVLYTRIVCNGLFFGARQSRRRS